MLHLPKRIVTFVLWTSLNVGRGSRKPQPTANTISLPYIAKMKSAGQGKEVIYGGGEQGRPSPPVALYAPNDHPKTFDDSTHSRRDRKSPAFRVELLIRCYAMASDWYPRREARVSSYGGTGTSKPDGSPEESVVDH